MLFAEGRRTGRLAGGELVCDSFARRPVSIFLTSTSWASVELKSVLVIAPDIPRDDEVVLQF